MKDKTDILRRIGDQLSRRAIQSIPKTYDPETHTVDVVVATETPTTILDFERWEFIDEILLMDGMELPQGRTQVPLLNTHDRWNVESILGSVTEIKTVSDRKEAKLTFASTEEAGTAETLVTEGHLTDISCGYKPLEAIYVPEDESAVVNGRTFKGPVKVTKRWMLKEVSLVAIGADVMSVVRSPEIVEELAERGLPRNATDQELIEFLRQELQNNKQPSTPQRKDPPMKSPEELAADQRAEQERQEALNREKKEAAEKERERIANIYATATRHAAKVVKMDELREQAIKDEWSAERFNTEVLNRYTEPTTPVAPAAPKVGLREFVKPWQRRSVMLLTAKTAQAVGNQERAQKYFNALNEAIRSMSDVQRDAEDVEAAEKIRTSGLTPDQQYRLASSLSAGAGASLVPTPLLAEIFILVEKWGVARRYFRPVPMTADTLKLDSLVTEAVAYWVTQGSNITASDLVFGQGTLTLAKLAGISAWTSELEEDAAIAWLPIFVDSLARAIRKKEDLAGFIGDGTATYGSFTGMLNASTNVITMDAGKIAFDDASADDYKALRDGLNIDFRDGARYFLAPAQVSALEGLKDLQGRYIYREPAAGLPAMLWGYPIADDVGINALTQTSAAATKFAAFGNPNHILMGMKRELELVVSREGVLQAGDGSISFNALQADGAIVRMTERIGFKQILTAGIAVLKTAAQ